jgi:hypothetical protein
MDYGDLARSSLSRVSSISPFFLQVNKLELTILLAGSTPMAAVVATDGMNGAAGSHLR